MEEQQKRKWTPLVLIIIGAAFFMIMLILPLITVLYRSLRDGLQLYLSAITAKNTLSALKVSLFAAGDRAACQYILRTVRSLAYNQV